LPAQPEQFLALDADLVQAGESLTAAVSRDKGGVTTMADKDTTLRGGTPVASQQELIEFCQQASRAWVARAQSEVALWSELAAKLAATRSVPEAVQAYSECVSHQMKMSTEDAQRLFQDFQQITGKIAKSLGGGWHSGST
jgi:hypothetical protein